MIERGAPGAFTDRSVSGGCDRPLRVVVAGVSAGPVCGVRDHGRRLADAVAGAGHAVEWVWEEGAGRGGLARLAAALRETATTDAVVLQYSVFAFAWRGLPVGVPALAARLRGLGVPVVLFAHEFAYPWARRGWRGALQAITQRAALVPLVAASSAVVVTTDDRAEWFRTRRWLPRRPTSTAAVFSNIPVRTAAAEREVPGRVGVFSYGAEGLPADVVASAIAGVARVRQEVHLALIGAPGSDSEAGRRWQAAASAAGCPLVFTGVGTEEEVSAEISRCAVMVFPDPAGPSSRKTSLAAALAHGRAVVALDGPDTWDALGRDGAVALVSPAAEELAAAVRGFLEDGHARRELGQRAKAFAEANQSADGTAEVVLGAVKSAMRGRLRTDRPGRLHRFGFGRSPVAPVRVCQSAVRGALLLRMVLRNAPRSRLVSSVRFIRWHVGRRVGGRGVVVEWEPGARFALPYWSRLGGMVIATGSHEAAESALLDGLLRDGDVVVDVGANVGVHTIRSALRGAAVVAFEPDERAAATLSDNAALGGVAGAVRVERVALADHDGEESFHGGGDVTNHLGGGGTTTVNVRRLDTLAGEIPEPASQGLTILKIDAEGADLRVLDGAGDFLALRRPIVLVEAWDGGDEIRHRLENIGFHMFVPGAGGLEPPPEWFWQANLVAVPAEREAEVLERLGARPAPRPSLPRVVDWSHR